MIVEQLDKIYFFQAPSGTYVSNRCYSEVQNYDYSPADEKGIISAGHFTQMVWKSTKQIGCAFAVGPWKDYTNVYYIGCDYLPAGNDLGQYSVNVVPPTS